jgi:hypothetical protein
VSVDKEEEDLQRRLFLGRLRYQPVDLPRFTCPDCGGSVNERCNQCRGDRAVLLGKPKVASGEPTEADFLRQILVEMREMKLQLDRLGKEISDLREAVSAAETNSKELSKKLDGIARRKFYPWP